MSAETERQEAAERRYARCRCCGERWNIARGQRIPEDGYLCPRCEWGRRGEN